MIDLIRLYIACIFSDWAHSIMPEAVETAEARRHIDLAAKSLGKALANMIMED